MAQIDDLYAQLVTLTKLSRQEWEDIQALPPAGQRVALETYRHLDWTRDPDRVTQAVQLLTLIGQVAGAVTGVSSAVGGVAGAVSALKAL